MEELSNPLELETCTASSLLPRIYDELRGKARSLLKRESAGQTLQATALVHEAYLKLTKGKPQNWQGAAPFFAALTEVMRRCLVENARRKKRLKRGGDKAKADVDVELLGDDRQDAEVLALDEALTKLARQSPDQASLVKLRFFLGMTVFEAATVLGVSPRTADVWWNTARVKLRAELLD